MTGTKHGTVRLMPKHTFGGADRRTERRRFNFLDRNAWAWDRKQDGFKVQGSSKGPRRVLSGFWFRVKIVPG